MDFPRKGRRRSHRQLERGDQLSLNVEGAVRYMPLPAMFEEPLRRWWSFSADMSAAVECFQEARGIEPVDAPGNLRSALFIAGLVHYCRCFGKGGARRRLNPEDVFASDKGRCERHEYFVTKIRNRHLAHPVDSDLQPFLARYVEMADGAIGVAHIGATWVGPSDEELAALCEHAAFVRDYCNDKMNSLQALAVVDYTA